VSIRPILHLEEVRFLSWSREGSGEWELCCDGETDTDTRTNDEVESGLTEAQSLDVDLTSIHTVSVPEEGHGTSLTMAETATTHDTRSTPATHSDDVPVTHAAEAAQGFGADGSGPAMLGIDVDGPE
jgi:hypothetical protein